MDVGTGGHRGTRPHFSKSRTKCPFSCNLVALLGNFKDANMNRTRLVYGDFSKSKFQNFPRGAYPWTLLAVSTCRNVLSFHLVLYPSEKVLNHTSRNPDNVPLILYAPSIFAMLPTSLHVNEVNNKHSQILMKF